jgi:hypothetical protein
VRWLLALLAVLLGCAHDVKARYPSRPDEPTGTLVLTMARPASGVTVAINGLLVVDDEKTEHVVIEGVPVGTREIVVAANGSDKAFNVWVSSEHPTTVPLGVPEEGYGFLKSVAGSLLSIIVYSLINR